MLNPNNQGTKKTVATPCNTPAVKPCKIPVSVIHANPHIDEPLSTFQGFRLVTWFAVQVTRPTEIGTGSAGAPNSLAMRANTIGKG